MNTRRKIMGLAVLPVAGLLATGGAALAQPTGTPAGTQVVQQAATRTAGIPCPHHAVKVAAPQPCDHQAQAGQAGARMMEHASDGSCADHAGR